MSFFDADRWEEIWQTLSRNRRRSIMTALGIFWGIFMLTVLLGAGMGLGNLFRSTLGGMSTNTVLMNPQPTSMPYKGMPKNRWWNMENGDIDNLKALPEVQYAAGIVFGGTVHCSNGAQKADYGLMGEMPDMQKINPQVIKYGRFINEVDVAQKRKVCVIGIQIQKDLFPGIENPTGQTIQVNNGYYTVVGVMLKQNGVNMGSDPERTVIAPISLVQQIYGMGTKLHFTAVAGYDDVPSALLQDLCRKTVFANHQIAPDDNKAIWTMATEELFNKVQSLFSGISWLTWFVGLGTLIAGLIGVSNIMLVLVKERTQDIGIRRAIGAPPMAILSQIMSESFIIAFVAGLVGLAAGVGLLSLADKIYDAQVTIPNGSVGISWMISFGTGMLSLVILVVGSLLAGIIPSARALSIKAVDAIREE